MKKQYIRNAAILALRYFEDRSYIGDDKERTLAMIEDAEAAADYTMITSLERYKNLVQVGFFACYIEDVEEDMRYIFGDEWDKSRYITKGGAWKIKAGDKYIWSMYKHIMGSAVQHLAKYFNMED